MAAELQPPEPPITATTTTTTPTTSPVAIAATVPERQPENAAPPPPKRQRRPSVRLGEIGDQPAYDSHVRRSKIPWRLPKDSSKSVKARSLTNLVNGDENQEFQENTAANGDVNLEFGHRKKAKRGSTKRIVRSNWISKVDIEGGGESREDGDEGFRDFDPDPDSDSPLKEQSPVHSVDNVGFDTWHGQRRTGTGRGRVSENDGVEMDIGERKWEGVRSWLIELGLSRYAPVFEVHEVDDEVLPLLTLEDLKDMGINAVGSRRKLYSAIQKLRRGFS